MKNDEKRIPGEGGTSKYYILRNYDRILCRCKSYGKSCPDKAPKRGLVKIKNGLFVLFSSKIIFLQPYN